MTTETLYDYMNGWVSAGAPTGEVLAALREEYIRQMGVSTCTTCPDWKTDMFFHFRGYLRDLNLKLMSANNKYMIAQSTGSLYVAGLGLLVNTGASSNGTTVLTDQIAEDLLKADDGYKEIIVANPDYDESKAKPDPKAKAKVSAQQITAE